MILTITNTRAPADDLGYLLHKHPDRLQEFSLSFGKAHVFYGENTPQRCTASLLLDVDPVGLIRRKVKFQRLDQYVNDWPYSASSFMSVAISRVLNTALAGKCDHRPELVDTKLELRAELPVIGCSGGESEIRSLFEPLGYNVHAVEHPLDEQFPEWGASRYFSLAIEQEITLKELLRHVYVLIPVLDNQKHYWVDEAEVEKLLRRGEGWLEAHPERELIVNRYLRYQRSLRESALEQLIGDELPDPDAKSESQDAEEEAVERPMRLHDERLGTVMAVIKSSGAKSVLDLGCGSGKLITRLMKDREFTKIAGADISYRSLEIAQQRLHLDSQPSRDKDRVSLFQTALTYRDARLEGFDAAAVVEVIEHLDEARLAAFERVVFEHARPKTVVITTPNSEFNAKFDGLPAGEFRHQDHRFEWTRAQFESWAGEVAGRFGYSVRFMPIGPEDPALGAPSQMGVFAR